jgi:hypothetical protein
MAMGGQGGRFAALLQGNKVFGKRGVGEGSWRSDVDPSPGFLAGTPGFKSEDLRARSEAAQPKPDVPASAIFAKRARVGRPQRLSCVLKVSSTTRSKESPGFAGAFLR